MPLCVSSEELQCVNNINVDTSNCIEHCSGLSGVIVSKTKSKKVKDIQKIMQAYTKYKKMTTYPAGFKGILH